MSLALLGACHSVQWQADDALQGLRWRDRTAFVFGCDVVLAREEASAAEVVRMAAELRASLKAQGVAAPGATLWLAMGPTEVALAEDANALAKLVGQPAMAAPHDEMGRNMLLGKRSRNGREARAPTASEQQRMTQCVLRAITLPVDLSQQQLELPAQILARVQHAVLVATDAGLNSVVEQLLDQAIALQDLSILESAAFALGRGFAVSALLEKLVTVRQKALYAWLCSDRDQSEHAALARALGIQPHAEEMVQERLNMTQFVALPTTCFPRDPMAPAIDWSDQSTEVDFEDRFVIRVNLQEHAFFDAVGPTAPGQVLLMRKGAIEREHLDQLFDFVGKQPGKLLFRGTSKGLAAAVATLHAIERRGYSQQDARELWQEFGMPEVESFDFATLARFFGR